MSNVIFAMAQGETHAAISYDGLTWASNELDSYQSWKFMGGDSGKFLYAINDDYEKVGDQFYSYDTEWHIGLLELTADCIVVCASDSDTVVYSFNGYHFQEAP
jgi:hypothetical protein